MFRSFGLCLKDKVAGTGKVFLVIFEVARILWAFWRICRSGFSIPGWYCVTNGDVVSFCAPLLAVFGF